MKKILFLCLMLSAGFATAQDLFQKNLYSADRVMELRNDLDLSEAQATKIKKIHSENAGKFSTMKWDLDDETKKLKALLDETKIDQVAVQKQMDKVLALENSLKKQQLSTMVAIKNELTFEQQEILQTPRAQTVNGVSIAGYGKKSVSSGDHVSGYTSNYRVGKPLYGVAEPGSSSNPKVSVVVAGTNNSENPPLYIIKSKNTDLTIPHGALKDINPNDIESISVLKDKSAIDLYGEKGENGVVIITLKEYPKK
ncbi:TonB-dependent outer membrane receptor, SusC/RagA subfamily, signature region [Algoriphagus locisalis]|uniref:TonB-dependent outer membrane receptor, SusC/RagA subfamily, signature region n=1 Tax=Algoriphagus locisalis TaxID=305507 RepID=A0A1I7AEJ6_9BACT|nr:TonB-dependent receptor plug domain-containing protein [Algoriphagus locisalis]SFT73367.1 TonB-dependent outer membrane receptor, SusC/RagA subfamily, signature region [Algoriphagus locisalis]